MKRAGLVKSILVVFCVVMIAAVLWIDHFLSLASCQETLLSQVFSPDTHYLAQYYDLGCNATIGFAQKIKMVDIKDPFSPFKKGIYRLLPGISDALFGLDGTIFTFDSQHPKQRQIKMHWDNTNMLTIIYPESVRTYIQDKKWQAVSINYKPITNNSINK